jgi:hypothetical protein
MNKDLQSFKQNRIREQTAIFNNTLVRLNSLLALNVRNVRNSRASNKQTLINNLITRYNYDVTILKNNYNASIQKIQSFVPEFNVVKNAIKNKKALLIGINYTNTPYALSGCIDDADRMNILLNSRGFNNIKMLTDTTSIKPTRDNILHELKLFVSSALQGDILVFYYSGHGSYIADRNSDEIDGRDETLFSVDGKLIADDELKSILQMSMKKDVTLIGIFDSCHSGTVLDLKYNYLDSNNYDAYTENNRVSELPGNVIMISGCMDVQTSAEAMIENKAQGAMTWAFLQSINSLKLYTWRELLKSMRDILKMNGFQQIPQMCSDSICDIDSEIFI